MKETETFIVLSLNLRDGLDWCFSNLDIGEWSTRSNEVKSMDGTTYRIVWHPEQLLNVEFNDYREAPQFFRHPDYTRMVDEAIARKQ